MTLHQLHRERMGDEAHSERLGPLAGQRGAHLDALKPLEEMLHAKAPLPASYDVSRGQPPYFNEFTYTECLGLLLVQPQSCEMAARIMAYAAKAPAMFDGFDASDRIASRDKYELEGTCVDRPSVAFTPGSNIFDISVSREAMDRAMHSDPNLVIKLHPLTSPGLIEHLGITYGYHRLIDPTASGFACLAGCKTAYTTTTSEMGLYGFLMGKDVRNITAYGYEAQGVYNPVYRLLWGLGSEDAKATIKRLLNSPFSGFFHPDDPDVAEKMTLYFANAMELREPFKPLVYEYDPRAYAHLVNHQLRKRPRHAPSQDQRK